VVAAISPSLPRRDEHAVAQLRAAFAEYQRQKAQ